MEPAKRGFSVSSRSAFPHHPLPTAAQILHESCPASPSGSGSATAELHFPPSCASRGFFSMREQPTTSIPSFHFISILFKENAAYCKLETLTSGQQTIY